MSDDYDYTEGGDCRAVTIITPDSVAGAVTTPALACMTTPHSASTPSNDNHPNSEQRNTA